MLRFEEYSVEREPIVELPEETEEVWYQFSGMALAGCPSAKDVARIATQKSIDKSTKPSESESEEEESEEESSEEEEDVDPKVAEERRIQKDLKLLQSKIKTFE